MYGQNLTQYCRLTRGFVSGRLTPTLPRYPELQRMFRQSPCPVVVLQASRVHRPPDY